MRQSIKEVALVAGAGEIIFNVEDASEHNRISSQFPHNFFEIISLTAVDGVPALPTTGDYVTVVETAKDAGFGVISDGASIAAEFTGGTAQVADTNIGGSFSGNPQRIKITATAVDVAAAFRVVIRQNAT